MTSTALRFANLGFPLVTLLGACGGDSEPSAPVSTGRGGGSNMIRPQQVVLLESPSQGEGESLRLSDAEVLGSGGGDLRVGTSKMTFLDAAAPESICEKGRFESLAAVTPDDVCESGAWTSQLLLSGTGTHTNQESDSIGLCALIKDADHAVTYRLRILGDSYDAQGASVTFEYEPAR